MGFLKRICVDIDEAETRAFARKSQRRRTTDALRGARDKNNLSVEACFHDVSDSILCTVSSARRINGLPQIEVLGNSRTSATRSSPTRGCNFETL
ncbi:hypothetical protein [Paraburkholderia sp. BR10923]|uniref:hypothetical protein n=1 Tax=Paraburkholderia sp. BR10923 TaxID=3236992 RepID=UPI0034CEA2A3